MTTSPVLDAAGVLAAARRHRAEADAAEVQVLSDALAWAHLHVVAEEWEAARFGNTPVLIAGQGAPWVSEFCIAEFAGVLGTSTDAGRALLGDALEIAHRLPRIWARVTGGELQVWRARRIAQQTMPLTPQAAAHVDQQAAGFAHKLGPVAVERLVEEAIARFMPEVAAERAEQAGDGRHVTISHDHLAFTGTSSLYGTLDTADALDLEEALKQGAATLKAAGSEDSLDVRRSVALGELARGQAPFSLVEEGAQAPVSKPRDLTIYVHLDPDSDVVKVENAGGHLITKDTVNRWLNTGDAKVVIKPVIDLNQPISTSAYAIPERIREQVILRDPTCVFPHCNRRARRADIDHIHAYDPDGPPEQTSTENLAPLCRFHHRLKTHSGWTYTMVEPGTYLWHSPHGYTFLRDRQGTQDLTPRPVEPPGD